MWRVILILLFLTGCQRIAWRCSGHWIGNPDYNYLVHILVDKELMLEFEQKYKCKNWERYHHDK